jgi:hypothetical protein
MPPMNKAFTPSFQHFQRDIERSLESDGKAEKNEHGQTVYRGYPAALSRMFRDYITRGAFAPLVAEVRKWDWEWNYSDYLLELTKCLQEARNWPLLKELWAAVIAKRRTNYNKTKKAQRALPDRIPEDLVTKTRELLLESLHRLESYASELQQESDVRDYVEMIARVEKGIRA